MNRCLYCDRPAIQDVLGHSTRCKHCQQIYEEDARTGQNRLGDISKDPFSPINRFMFDHLLTPNTPC